MRSQRFHWFMVAICVLALLALAACSRGAADASDVRATLEVNPNPPAVGPATVAVNLAEQNGTPITGAKVRLEGTMSHAGMQPVEDTAREVAPGRYQTELHFTMDGDWFIVVHATLPDGRALEREISIGTVHS